MSTRTADPNELGAFLKARRAELTPRDVGLPEGGTPRRVPGLRREEVAQLASISTDYYTRLEQGRINASASVLAALARVLRLNDDQRAYLCERAGKHPTRPRSRPRQKVRPHMQRLLDHITDTPAMVERRNLDILAWNPRAAALMIDFAFTEEQMATGELAKMVEEADDSLKDWADNVGTDLAHGMAESPGWNVFALEDGVVYHTYSRTAPDRFLLAPYYYQLLDQIPDGRDADFPLRRHDEY